MRNIGIVSYNINGNFTNYGSALQSWALSRAVDRIGKSMDVQSKLIDYCPKELEECNVLNPYRRMWDCDDESKRMVELSMPAIRSNLIKIEDFYTYYFRRTRKKYYDDNFNDVIEDENIDGFICGSDTIWCVKEFNGFVEGYFANFDCMKGRSVAYAVSFGDQQFTKETCRVLNDRLKNFLSIGLRENLMLDYVKDHTDVLVQRVADPTLLLTSQDYEPITAERIIPDKYLLMYSRRYNKKMETFAEQMAKERGLKIVEISLRATNAQKGNLMMYDAGVEEFLSLLKHAEYVVTNSYHGMIMSIQFRKSFYGFSRDLCENKVRELLDLIGLGDRLLISGREGCLSKINIDYDAVHERISIVRKVSELFLQEALKLI